MDDKQHPFSCVEEAELWISDILMKLGGHIEGQQRSWRNWTLSRVIFRRKIFSEELSLRNLQWDFYCGTFHAGAPQ